MKFFRHNNQPEQPFAALESPLDEQVVISGVADSREGERRKTSNHRASQTIKTAIVKKITLGLLEMANHVSTTRA